MTENHNPDILNCLANLSSDEVFTPPELANKMLDLLPQKLFTNPNTKFLDPCCKSGVFLREITKRLIEGLKTQIPDLQDRIDHILKNQVFGIALTQLTSEMSRRTLYCSKKADGKYSVTKVFVDPADEQAFRGNIKLGKPKHSFVNGKCTYCGADESVYGKDDREQHAYRFIHTKTPEEIFKMKFDVIIGNPPYQMSDGGAFASAKPIYHLFIEAAKKLNPHFIIMITPSRWFTGGKGLDDFRLTMLKDERLTEIHDFVNASDCFQGVEIKGGVSYFLWTHNHSGNCDIYSHNADSILSKSNRPLLEKNCDVFIRNNDLVSIFKKVQSFKESSFSSIVSSMKPYGLRGDFFKSPAKYSLPEISEIPFENTDCITIYGLDKKLKRSKRYVKKDYPFPKKDYIDGYKMFMARNQGNGLFGEVFSTPIFAEPNEVCTETYIVIGLFKTKDEMENCYSYIKTKFFRAMVGVKKNDQGAAQGVYQFVPLQDFSKPWTDQELYKKYNLSPEEIDFIESMIRPMQ